MKAFKVVVAVAVAALEVVAVFLSGRGVVLGRNAFNCNFIDYGGLLDQ